MGLRMHDLEDTILSRISIDEFEPKSGTTKEIIVVGFYLIDKKPAKDLNRFIQRGYFDVVDSEVSPNPNENGEYMVFVEFKRTPEFLDVLPLFLKDIEKLTGEMDWEVKPYLADQYYSFTDPSLEKFIITNPNEYKNKKEFIKGAKMENLFTNTFVKNAIFENNVLILEGVDNVIGGSVLTINNISELEDSFLCESGPIVLDEKRETIALQQILGNTWTVTEFKDYCVMENNQGDAIVLSDTQFIYK